MNKLLNFCTNTFYFLFKGIFSERTPDLDHLLKADISLWQSVAKPDIRHDGSLYIFPYEHKMVRDAMQHIKNFHSKELTDMLSIVVSDFLTEELADMALLENFTDPVVVAIPSSRKKLLKRGFNPSELLLTSLKPYLSGVTFEPKALLKTKETKAQKDLSRTERLSNVAYSMQVNPKLQCFIKERCVIVVDDIATTGATLKEAERALQRAGARKVLKVAYAH